RPSTSTCPAVGSTSRFTIFRVVVLPQPDGPTSTTTCPAGTVSDRSSTAGGPLAEYRFVTWRNSTSTPCRPSGMAGTVSEGYALVTRACSWTSVGCACRPRGLPTSAALPMPPLLAQHEWDGFWPSPEPSPVGGAVHADIAGTARMGPILPSRVRF